MIRLSEHKRNNFQTCRLKYKLKLEYQEKEKGYPLALGIVVQAALASWDLDRNETKAVEAAFKSIEGIVVEKGDELLEEAVSLLDVYWTKYRDTLNKPLATETSFGRRDSKYKVLIAPDIEHSGRFDGIDEYVGKLYVKERKVTGQQPGNFWKAYDLHPQSIGYVYAARQIYGEVIADLPLVGYEVDAIFRANYKSPEPKCERRYFEVSSEVMNRWHTSMIGLGGEVERAHKEDNFFPNWGACHAYYGECEFFQYCSSNLDQAVLLSTHEKIDWEKVKQQRLQD